MPSETGVGGDLRLAPAAGLPNGLRIPVQELTERFSRSSGPGGQSVNTTDSRVELQFDLARSTALDERQRARALAALAPRLTDGTISVVSSEQRSQLQNRIAARERLGRLLTAALAPPAAPRRATRPSRAARQRRLEVKRQRGAIKSGRARVRDDPER